MCLPFPDLEARRLEKGEMLGYEYEIVKNRHGYRCGYIRVLPGHPWFGRSYRYSDEDSGLDGVAVHGGITFAEHGKACPTHGEEAEWWVGFDCAHSGDAADPALMDEPDIMVGDKTLAEMMQLMDVWGHSSIKDNDYVRGECQRLAEQALQAEMDAVADDAI